MSRSNKFSSIIPSLITKALQSTINNQHAAAVIKGNKMFTPPCANVDRNMIMGYPCGSQHAEAHALMHLCGSDLSFADSTGRCYLSSKGKGAKVKEVGYYCYQSKHYRQNA